MIISIDVLIRLNSRVYLYTAEKLYKNMSFSYFDVDDAVLLMRDTMNIQQYGSDRIGTESIYLVFDAHFGDDRHYTYTVDIPIFSFSDVIHNISTINPLSNNKSRINIKQTQLISTDIHPSLGTQTKRYYEWDELVTINKFILGKRWQYWIKQCGYDIVIDIKD